MFTETAVLTDDGYRNRYVVYYNCSAVHDPHCAIRSEEEHQAFSSRAFSTAIAS
jgi:hypothetical protein